MDLKNQLNDLWHMKREHETLNMWTPEEIWKKEIEIVKKLLEHWKLSN